MITIKQLKTTIADLEKTVRDLPSFENRKRSTGIQTLAFLKQCIRFMETKPVEMAVQKQLADVETKIKIHKKRIVEIQKQFPNPAAAKTQIAMYSKNYDLKRLYAYQTTLRFILGLSDNKKIK